MVRRAELLVSLAVLAEQSKPLSDELEEINQRAKDVLKDSGKPSIKRGDFRLSFLPVAGRQAWKALAMKWKPADEDLPTPTPGQRLVVADA